jgi:hypothetical protein
LRRFCRGLDRAADTPLTTGSRHAPKIRKPIEESAMEIGSRNVRTTGRREEPGRSGGGCLIFTPILLRTEPRKEEEHRDRIH